MRAFTVFLNLGFLKWLRPGHTELITDWRMPKIDGILVAERIVGLQEHVRRLESIMAVCSYCKSVRGDGDEWMDMERYAARHLHALPSHTVCPRCFQTRVKPSWSAWGYTWTTSKLAEAQLHC